MRNDIGRRSHEILMRAIDLSDSERREFVRKSCADDDELRQRVDHLISSLLDTKSFLETPALADQKAEPAAHMREVSAAISGYEIVRVIGDGGMATVYEAVQDRPKRVVALKVLKRGLVRSSAVRRFEFETETLARLRHRGIAQIYEAGAYADPHGDSIPYFAMEYVEQALPITRYADENRLDLEDRLRLFIEVCDAVQHGHQNGVIHRDLKPSNVLVDASGCPKVIDFGIARSTDPEDARITQRTDLGKLIGTLHSMSPEQCAGDEHVDLRTDVYSLGTILYELLCGRVPHDLSKVPLPEALRIIQQDSVARPGALNPRLHGDLEVVLLMALEKDRERRYQTASELAADLRRVLEHQPIMARPATTMYQLRKFARRHRVPVAAAIAIVATLIVGIAATARQAYVATLARQDAHAQQAIAEERLERALEAEALADA
ncbi:MAG: serine/threonine-protein kinase, partial [Planctomycetota bacterium]|nr:serine/threonine-protein kinase [Planctomycetota bacterium]